MLAIVLAIMLLVPGVASAQTYLGVLTNPPNTGKGGSCCSNVAELDASNAAVPPDCIGCSVITQAQYNAYLAAAVVVPHAPLLRPVVIATGTPTLGTCANGVLNAGSADGLGSITISGPGSAACSLVFSAAYAATLTAPPACQISWSGTTALTKTITTSGFSVVGGAALNGGQINYYCPQ